MFNAESSGDFFQFQLSTIPQRSTMILNANWNAAGDVAASSGSNLINTTVNYRAQDKVGTGAALASKKVLCCSSRIQNYAAKRACAERTFMREGPLLAISVATDENVLINIILGTAQKPTADTDTALLKVRCKNYCRSSQCPLQKFSDRFKQSCYYSEIKTYLISLMPLTASVMSLEVTYLTVTIFVKTTLLRLLRCVVR